MVGATHGEDAFELVQNLFRFQVMEYGCEGQKYVSVLHLGGVKCAKSFSWKLGLRLHFV
jgi:hypothetical protein